MSSQIPWNDLLTDALERFPREAGRRSMPSAEIVDPAAVASRVFNVDFSLGSRDALIGQLKRLRTGPAGGPAIAPRGAVPAPRVANNAGPFVSPYLAAQVLQENVAGLADIEPIDPKTDNGCDHKTIVPLITGAVAAIVDQLRGPLPPLADSVDTNLGTLCGYVPDVNTPAALDPKTVEGDLGRFRNRCGLNVTCSVEDEKVATKFSNVVHLTNMLVQSWHPVRALDGDDFLSIAIYSLQRALYGIAVTLDRLRELVPMSAWITTQLKASPPIIAWDLYQWLYGYASQGAQRDLEKGGRDGIHNVQKTMTEMRRVVRETLETQGGIACSAAFKDDTVKPVIAELGCHMDRVIRVTTGLPSARPRERKNSHAKQ